MKSTTLESILRQDKTIFTYQEILLLSEGLSPNLLKRRLSHYVKQGKLYRPRKGFYSKDTHYDPLELATKLYTPSYVSFQTVLGSAGAVFQYSSHVHLASYKSLEIKVEHNTFIYRKLKNTILTNQKGIQHTDHYMVATPERAFLDVVYLEPDYYFDNLSELNWDKIYDLLPLYGRTKRMTKNVDQYYKQAKDT